MDDKARKFAIDYVKSRTELNRGDLIAIVNDAIDAYSGYGKPYKHPDTVILPSRPSLGDTVTVYCGENGTVIQRGKTIKAAE